MVEIGVGEVGLVGDTVSAGFGYLCLYAVELADIRYFLQRYRGLTRGMLDATQDNAFAVVAL